eukprot:UN23180
MISVNDVWGAFGIVEGINHVNITSPLGNAVFFFDDHISESKDDAKFSRLSSLLEEQITYNEYSFCDFNVDDINIPTLSKISAAAYYEPGTHGFDLFLKYFLPNWKYHRIDEKHQKLSNIMRSEFIHLSNDELNVHVISV